MFCYGCLQVTTMYGLFFSIKIEEYTLVKTLLNWIKSKFYLWFRRHTINNIIICCVYFNDLNLISTEWSTWMNRFGKGYYYKKIYLMLISKEQISNLDSKRNKEPLSD